MRNRPSMAPGAARGVAATWATALAVSLGATSPALASGGAAERPEPGSGAESAPRYLSLVSSAGRAWVPAERFDEGLQQAPFMTLYEVTRYPHRLVPSPAEEAAARELVMRSRRAAERHGWLDRERGLADGFSPMFNDRTHFANRAFVADGRVLDPERPEFLMYLPTERGPRLAGFMFLAEAGRHGPQIGGPLTAWHYHVWPRPMCLFRGLLLVARADAGGGCSEGEPSRRSPEMLHVWFVDHPQGAFATDMTLPPWVRRRLAAGPE